MFEEESRKKKKNKKKRKQTNLSIISNEVNIRIFFPKRKKQNLGFQEKYSWKFPFLEKFTK